MKILQKISTLVPEMDNFDQVPSNFETVKNFQDFVVDFCYNFEVIEKLNGDSRAEELLSGAKSAISNLQNSANFINFQQKIHSKIDHIKNQESLANIAAKIENFDQTLADGTRSEFEAEEQGSKIQAIASNFLIFFQKILKNTEKLATPGGTGTEKGSENQANFDFDADNFTEFTDKGHIFVNSSKFSLDFLNFFKFDVEQEFSNLISTWASDYSIFEHLEQLILSLKTSQSSPLLENVIKFLLIFTQNLFPILHHNLAKKLQVSVFLTQNVYQMFVILLENGFCKPKEIDELENELNNENNPDEDQNEDEDGTETDQPQGLADTNDDLSGANDVTNEIEEEWQLEGLRDEKDEKDQQDKQEQEEQKNSNQQQQDQKDNAMEVEDLEFEADYEDVKQDREELEEEHENMENKMDKIEENEDNQEQKETLDERMWGEDEPEEEKPEGEDDEENEKGDEKKEDDKFEDTEGKGMDKKDRFLGAKDDRLVEDAEEMKDDEDENGENGEEDDNEMQDDREFDENEYDDNFEGKYFF